MAYIIPIQMSGLIYKSNFNYSIKIFGQHRVNVLSKIDLEFFLYIYNNKNQIHNEKN